MAQGTVDVNSQVNKGDDMYDTIWTPNQTKTKNQL